MNARNRLFALLTVLVVLSASLAGCGATPTSLPTATPTQPNTAAPTLSPPTATTAPATPTLVPPTATLVPPTATPKGPTVGGKLVIALPADVDTLDPALLAKAHNMKVAEFIGGNLLCMDPSGKLVGYLAESWKISPDGLSLQFTLKKGIKFHDGTPLRASDYVYTINRMLDPETKSAQAGPLVEAGCSVEAVDDYTFRINLTKISPALLGNIGFQVGVWAPISQAYEDTLEGPYGRKPMSVGPYTFREWVTGSKIVLERNPDFDWGPDFAHKGPFYIDTLEFRIIPEPATVVAGLETGEIGFAWAVAARELTRFQDKSKYQVFESLFQGIYPYLVMNDSKAPFTDIRVRKAFNLALDRETIIKVVADGAGIVQYGPISPSVPGYWPGVEKIGYGFDLSQAKASMKEAGYVDGTDGILEKDGTPLKLTVNVKSTDAKLGEVLQQQYKALGVDLDIKAMEVGVLISDLFDGKFDLSWMAWGAPSANILIGMFHSKNIGTGANVHRVQDPELDALLDRIDSTSDIATRTEGFNEVQQTVVEKAYIVPLYSSIKYSILSARVKGAVFFPYDVVQMPFINDAYIESD